MTKTEAIAYAETVRNLAAMLEITVQAVYDWPEIIPEQMAARLEKISKGAMVYDHVFYMNLKKEQKQAA